MLCRHRCLFGFVSTHTQRERERSAVSHGCELLQKISPHLLLSPPPHLASIIPVFSKQLRWQQPRNIAGKWRQAGISSTGSRFFPSPPSVCWPVVRSPAIRTSTHRLCTVPVAKRGGVGRPGLAPWEALCFRKEGERSQPWKISGGLSVSWMAEL